MQYKNIHLHTLLLFKKYLCSVIKSKVIFRYEDVIYFGDEINSVIITIIGSY